MPLLILIGVVVAVLGLRGNLSMWIRMLCLLPGSGAVASGFLVLWLESKGQNILLWFAAAAALVFFGILFIGVRYYVQYTPLPDDKD